MGKEKGQQWQLLFQNTFLNLYLFIITFISSLRLTNFLQQFRIHNKIKGKVWSFTPHLSLPPTGTASPPAKALPDGALVTTDEPARTRHSHPKSTVYLKVHSGCRTFYGFGKMCNDIYSLIVSYRLVSRPWKPSVFLLCIPPPNSGKHWSVLLSPYLCLFQDVI